MTSQDVIEAADVLNLSTRTSQKEIRHRYQSLIKEWHPDRCKETPEACHEMALKINNAYKCLMAYFEICPVNLQKEAIQKNLRGQDSSWWIEHFGNDPIWS